MPAIKTERLTKRYADYLSLSECSFEVRAGELYGLLGPNGAGKTTLIRTLLGFISPTSGNGIVCGYDIVKQSLLVRREISYLPADARLYLAMRGRDLLDMFSGLHHHGDVQLGKAIAKRLDLDLSRRVMFMSTGMRQKLALTIALGCRPSLTILDEPTANLDPNVRAEVMQLICEVRERGGTVLLSSHIFSDIDDTCDRVGILCRGQLAATQDLQQLQKMHVVQWQGNAEQLKQLRTQLLTGVELDESHDGSIALTIAREPEHWLSWLAKQPGTVLSIQRAGVQVLYDRVAREHS